MVDHDAKRLGKRFQEYVFAVTSSDIADLSHSTRVEQKIHGMSRSPLARSPNQAFHLGSDVSDNDGHLGGSYLHVRDRERV